MSSRPRFFVLLFLCLTALPGRAAQITLSLGSIKHAAFEAEGVSVAFDAARRGEADIRLGRLLVAGAEYREGGEARGTVYAFNPFGAVISLSGGLQGQIHITEFGGPAEMRAALQQGKEYAFVVSAVKSEEKRIYLKLKG